MEGKSTVVMAPLRSRKNGGSLQTRCAIVKMVVEVVVAGVVVDMMTAVVVVVGAVLHHAVVVRALALVLLPGMMSTAPGLALLHAALLVVLAPDLDRVDVPHHEGGLRQGTVPHRG